MHRKKTWLFSVLIGFLSFILVRIWHQRKSTTTQKPLAEPEQMILIDDRTDESQNTAVQPPAKLEVDDLRKIEGIGPKIAGLLVESGISKFEQLSKIEVLALEEILKNANLRFAKPATWPEQASYAARGDWEGLKSFQNQLKGDVRT